MATYIFVSFALNLISLGVLLVRINANDYNKPHYNSLETDIFTAVVTLGFVIWASRLII